jgi:hypothetical protein
MALREEGKGLGVGGPGSSWSRCLAGALAEASGRWLLAWAKASCTAVSERGERQGVGA